MLTDPKHEAQQGVCVWVLVVFCLWVYVFGNRNKMVNEGLSF